MKTKSGYEVFVHHSPFDPRWPNDRYTRVTAIVGGQTFEGYSFCSHQDQFCRLTGRKVAVERVLSGMRTVGIGPEARREIFLAVCPEYDVSSEEAA